MFNVPRGTKNEKRIMTQEERKKRNELLPQAQFVFDTLNNWGVDYAGIYLGRASILVSAESSQYEDIDNIWAFITKHFPKQDEIEVDDWAGGYRLVWTLSFD